MSLGQLNSMAGRELSRRLVRKSFEGWCRYRMAKVDRIPALHHLMIIHTIERLLRGELPTRNAMLLMPPGAAKSTYTSKLLPAWFCNPEQYPRELMLACSYNKPLVQGFGREARDMVNEEREVLGMTVSDTASASDDWRTNLGGGYFCAGINAGIAGHRALLGLIDDYMGTEEDADSDTIREKNWQWYWNDFFPRLLPHGFQFIIANRRNEDDLVGRLLAKEPERWTLIKLPFFAGPNDPLGRKAAPLSLLFDEDNPLSPEALETVQKAVIDTRLWPEWFTEEQARVVLTMPARTRSCLYQQEPTPEEGTFFKKASLVEYKSMAEVPDLLRMYVGSDYALHQDDLHDYTCFLPGGMDAQGVLWILPDWFWEQVNTLTACKEMLKMARRRKPIVWWAGKENITGSIAPFLQVMMREENTYISIEELSEAKHKEAKAQPIKARMDAKMVRFPSFVPGWDEARKQLLAFPGGTHDDFVDALAKLGQGLGQMVRARAPVIEPNLTAIINPRLTMKWMKEQSERRDRMNRCLAIRDN